jgi:hypothetical protein
MRATLIYDGPTRLAIAAVPTRQDVAPCLRAIERSTGERLDRETLVVEEGVHLVNEVQPGDVLVVDEGDHGLELDGLDYRFAVRRPNMGARKACEMVGGDVELVADRTGWHVLRWNETTRTWSETASSDLAAAQSVRRVYAATRALEIMGADPRAAEGVVNAIVSFRRLNRVEPIVLAARRALAV